ncbi:MAG: hypothetical protein ACFFDP_05335 [Promethearchaeota archaeon]
MAESGAARALLIVGAILQFFVGILYLFLFAGELILLGIMELANPNDPGIPLTGALVSYFAFGVLIGLVLIILWFIFAIRPSKLWKVIVITGIIGIIMCGILPGLLVLLGGIKGRKKVEDEV